MVAHNHKSDSRQMIPDDGPSRTKAAAVAVKGTLLRNSSQIFESD
jgi:hypothetical protein